MSNRRTFLKSSLAVAAGFAVGHISPVSAEPACLPKGVVYTKEHPGKWSKKVKGHMPNVKVEGNRVTVTTTHGMSEEHYIEWVEVIVGGKAYRQFLKPGEAPEATFCVEADQVTAREYCNLHGLWKA